MYVFSTHRIDIAINDTIDSHLHFYCNFAFLDFQVSKNCQAMVLSYFTFRLMPLFLLLPSIRWIVSTHCYNSDLMFMPSHLSIIGIISIYPQYFLIMKHETRIILFRRPKQREKEKKTLRIGIGLILHSVVKAPFFAPLTI